MSPATGHQVSNVTEEELNNKLKSMFVHTCWYANDNNKRFCKEHNVFGVDVLYVTPVHHPYGGKDQSMQDKYTLCPVCVMEGKASLNKDLEKV